jgi:Zn-dependent peptidase ImmA (M78 family)
MGYGTPKWSDTQAYEVYNRFGASEEEFEANEFAAAFLMPEEDFKAAAKRANSVASEIALSFGVSADAALNRGRWLGIFPWS